MTIRTTSKTVTFAQPFVLRGVGPEPIPPGTYRVDTDEELIESTSNLQFLAYRRVATMIHLTNGQVFVVNPTDLEASMLRDAGVTVVPSANG